MPKVVLFRGTDGSVPILEWLESLPERAVLQCRARVRMLSELGHLMRRPTAAYLRDGVYELRIRSDLVPYRLLYFFHGQSTVVLSHGFMKKSAAVPEVEIVRALQRKASYEADPAARTHEVAS
jgi:phage-related protein